MAKKNSSELLEGILNLLDSTLGEILKSKGKAGTGGSAGGKASNFFANISGIGAVAEADIKGINKLGESLKSLSSAILPISKLSKKDIDHTVETLNTLATAIKTFGIEDGALKSFNNIITAFVSLNSVFMDLSKNFFKTILTFNPAKAWIIGKRLALFYSIIFNQFKKMAVLNMVNAIKPIPTSMTFIKKIAIFKVLLKTLTDIPTKDVVKMALMGKLLNAKVGRNIGSFFSALVSSLTNQRGVEKKMIAAAAMAASMSLLITSLTVSLVAVVALLKIAGFAQVVLGFGILALLVNGSIKLMKKLGSLEFKTSAEKAFPGIAAMSILLLSLSITLALVVSIVKHNKLVDLISGFAILTALVYGSWQIMKKLSSTQFRYSAKNALLGIAAIVSLMLGMGIAMLLTIKLGKNAEDVIYGSGLLVIFTTLSILLFKSITKFLTKAQIERGLQGITGIIALVLGLSIASLFTIRIGKKLEEVLLGFVVLSAIVVGSIYLFKLLAKKLKQSTIIKGLIGVAGISLMIISLSIAMLFFTGYLRRVQKLSVEAVVGGIALAAGVILGVVGLVHILSPLAADPIFWIGVAMTTVVAGVILSITFTMNRFLKFIKKASKIDPATMQNTLNIITGDGGMISTLTAIIKGLAKVGLWGAVKARIISKTIRPIFTTLSMFVDLISKMAKLQIADEWDANGKPIHYTKITAEDFNTAADTLVASFTSFVNKLSTGFKDIIGSLMFKFVINTLFPAKKNKSGIGTVIRTISDFIDVIFKMKSGKVPIQWDGNGKPIAFVQLADEDFANAAKTLASAFGTFIVELTKSFRQIGLWARDNIEKMAKPLSLIMNGVGNIINPIMTIAAGKIQIGDKTYDLNVDKMKTAATKIVDVIQTFVTGLGDLEVYKIENRKIRRMMKTVGIIGDTFKNLLNLNISSDSTTKINNLTSSIDLILNYLKDIDKFKSANKSSKKLKGTLVNVADGLEILKPTLSVSAEGMKDLAKAFKELDMELIANEENRSKAMQTISSNFKDMANSIKDLNKAMTKSLAISKAWDIAKTMSLNNIMQTSANMVSAATHNVKDTVSNIFNPNKKEEEQKKQDEIQRENNRILANVIANAVANALNDWSESHKDLTVQFSGDGKKVFGEVYSN